jgi:hypothetical protein
MNNPKPRRAWFGPKALGTPFGAAPASWEGWALTGAFLAIFIAVGFAPNLTAVELWGGRLVLTVIFLAVARMFYDPHLPPS